MKTLVEAVIAGLVVWAAVASIGCAEGVLYISQDRAQSIIQGGLQ